jgi:hypothetical protein
MATYFSYNTVGKMYSPSFYITAEATTGVSVFGAVYYGSVLLFIIFLILVFVHFTITPIFALTANDPGIIVISGTGDRELAYTASDGNVPAPANPRNAKLKNTQLPSCNYTIGVDIKVDTITNTNQTSYPIAILYRDSVNVEGALGPPPRGYMAATATIGATATTTGTLNTKYSNTNIIVWADGITKDIQVTLITTDKNGLSVDLSMTGPIHQPQSKWFRLTIVLANSVAEIYLNGSLVSTINTGGNALRQIPSNDFYPPMVTADIGGISIANMSMWPRILTSKEIRAYESAPMSRG